MAGTNAVARLATGGRFFAIPAARGLAAIADLAIVFGFFALTRHSWLWAINNLTRHSARLNLLLVGAAVAALAVRFATQRLWRATPDIVSLRPTPMPLFLFVTSVLLYAAADSWVDIHRLSLLIAGAGAYALLGLFLPRGRWRCLLAPFALLLASLPFAEFLDIYLGFPVRMLTAELVHAALGNEQLSAQTILVFENGAAQIDLPCSGVKSLWAGAVLSLAITWLDNRRIGGRWLACNLAFVVALLLANLVRVWLLVLVGIVLQQPRVAAVLHVPLGLAGFLAAALFLFLLLCLAVPTAKAARDKEQYVSARRRNLVRMAVGSLLVGATLFAVRRPIITPAAPAPGILLPDELHPQALPLTEMERRFFADQGATRVQKSKFSWRHLSGSVLIVESHTFRAHHLPDRCLAAAGLVIEDRRTILAGPDHPIRLVTLRHHPGNAAYWFLSPTFVTEDYAARVWADMVGQERHWVLVSVLFTGAVDSEADELFGFLSASLSASLFGG